MIKKHKVTIRPENKTIEVEEGKDLLTALKEAAIYVKSSCAGHATCADCAVKILSGEDHLTAPPFEEIRLLGNVFHLTKERLACQTRLLGDVTIDIGRHNKQEVEEKYKAKSKPKSKIFIKKKGSFSPSDSKEHELSEQRSSVQVGQKKLDGGKRPKFFDTDKVDYSKNSYSRPLPPHKIEKRNNQRIEKKSEESKAEVTITDNQKEFKKFRS